MIRHSMTKVMIQGISGRMGQEIKALFDAGDMSGLTLAGGSSIDTSEEQ